MNPIRESIATTLRADAQLAQLADGVYFRKAPQGTAPPMVIFAVQTPSLPRYTFQGPPMEWETWTVRGISEDRRVAEEIDARCRALLDGQTLDIDDTTCLYCRREMNVDFDEEVDGESYEHVGAVYRLITEPSS